MPQIKIIYISVAIIAAASLLFFGYFLGQKGKEVSGPGEKPATFTPKDLGAGEVGEVGENPLVSPTMPLAIFSTSGTITELKSDRIILRGDGSNFADGIPRTLTAIITDSTITFNKNQTLRYPGKEGLKQLKAGTEILIDSRENIRGKTEFQAKTINIL